MYAPKLRQWREATGTTQAMLSERSGITEHTISRIEHGYPLRPTTARKLAEALGVSIVDLMESPPEPVGKAEASDTRPSQAETSDEDEARRYQEALERVAESYGVPVESLLKAPAVAEFLVREAEEGPSRSDSPEEAEWSHTETLEDFSRWAAGRISGVVEDLLTELDNRFFDAVEAEPYPIDADLRDNTLRFLADIRAHVAGFESELGKEPPRVQ